jgi:hypothetical protein
MGFLPITAKTINPEKTLWYLRMLGSNTIAEQWNRSNRTAKRRNRKSQKLCNTALTVDFLLVLLSQNIGA